MKRIPANYFLTVPLLLAIAASCSAGIVYSGSGIDGVNTASFTVAADGPIGAVTTSEDGGNDGRALLCGAAGCANRGIEVAQTASGPQVIATAEASVTPGPGTWLMMLGGGILVFAASKQRRYADNLIRIRDTKARR